MVREIDSRRVAIVAAGAILGGLVAIVAPTVVHSSSQVTVEDMIPTLATPRSADDALPDDVDLSQLGAVDPATVRSLGNDGGTGFWVGLGESSKVCLIMTLSEGGEYAGSACVGQRDFYDGGVALALSDHTGSTIDEVEAYLLPADVDATSLQNSTASTSGESRQSETLLTNRSDDIPDVPVEVSRSGADRKSVV